MANAKPSVLVDRLEAQSTVKHFNVHKLAISSGSRPPSLCTLAANTELLDQVQVSLAVFAGNVLEVALALTYQLQQTTASSKIFLVLLQVLGQFLDTLSCDANLYGSATGVGFVLLQVFYDCCFLLTCNHTTGILSD